MKKIAFMFPGQGAQAVSMGLSLYENFESARKVFDTANEVLNKDIKKLCFEEPEEAFARRNFGKDHGSLYKPDYKNLGAENYDVALKYIDEDPDSYHNIFENAKRERGEEDSERVVGA